MRSVFSFWRREPHAAAAALIVLGALIRYFFVASGQLNLVQDEAQYWDWSRHPQLSYYSKGPLIAWLIGAGTAVFGDTELGVRIGAVAGSAVGQGILYAGMAFLMNKPRQAVLALFILNTMPMFLASGILMTTDNPLFVCWTAALFCLYATAARPEARWPWLGLGAAMAVGVLAKYAMLWMAVVALLHVFFLFRHGGPPRGHVRKLVAAMGVGAVLGFLPILAWNMNHDWATFRHVGRLAGVAPAATDAALTLRPDRFLEYMAGQIGLVSPWWAAFMLYGGGRALARALRRVPSNAARDRREALDAALLCCGFWPLFLFFLVWSLHARVYANWPAMCYIAGAALAAYGVDRVLEKYRADAGLWRNSALPLTRRLLPVWAGLGVIVSLLMVFQGPLSGVLPEKYDPPARLKGWEDLGRRVGELRDGLPDPERVFVFSDAYDVTAQLAFYVPGQPKVFCADFGRRLNQYDFWPGPEDRKGWDAVFVRRKPFKTLPPQLKSMFREAGTPEAYRSTHRGGPGREFGIVVLRGFTGEWPKESRGVY